MDGVFKGVARAGPNDPATDVFEGVPRGVDTDHLDKWGTPNARWLTPKEILRENDYRFDGSKVFLGTSAGAPIGITDDRHAMLVAGSRAGKGRSVIVPTLLEYKGSVLAIDPKGELAKITARRRGEGNGRTPGLGQKVAVLDPFRICPSYLDPYQASFNPLSLLDPESETVADDAALIADAIVVPSNDKDLHWDETAKNFIEGVILHVLSAPEFEGRRNLLTVRSLLTHANEGKKDDVPDLAVAMIENSAFDGRVESAAVDFYSKPDNERGSVQSCAVRHTKFLDSERLGETLKTNSFSLSDLKDAPGGMTIYLCLPAGRMATHGRWFRLIINLALEMLERNKHIPKIPVLFCLDEFAVLEYMKQIEVAAGHIAGFGVKLFTILQDLSQLKAIYKDRWETFISNAGVLQFFGNNDVTTLEFISKRLGKASLKTERGQHLSLKQQQDGARGDSWGIEVHDLVTPDEASRFFGRDDPLDRQLVIHSGHRPMILQRVRYDSHPMFENTFDS
jgi:type IV secretion system protein VirD4